MGVDLYNREKYLDPTAHAALTNLENSKKKMVYICSPFAGDVDGNILSARRYGRFAVSEKAIPIIPHLMYPQFLEEDDPDETKLGMQMGLELLSQCQELWAFGNQLSTGIAVEVKQAKQWKIPIRYFTTDCRETGKCPLRQEQECFAYRRGGCRILTVNKCQGESCRFLKTKAEVVEGQKKALKRIRSLGNRGPGFLAGKSGRNQVISDRTPLGDSGHPEFTPSDPF